MRAVNAKINAVDKQKKLKKLLSLLTFDVDILSPLPKNAPFKEQLARVEAVYEAFLEAAQITRKQLLEAARSLESRTVTSGLRGNEEEVKVAADG